MIAHLRAERPELPVDVVPEATEQPFAALRAGRIDVALAMQPELDDDLHAEELFTDELYAVVADGDPLARRRWLRPADFAARTLILYTGRRQMIVEEVLAPAGIQPGRLMELRMTEGIIELARAGLGIAVIAGWALDDFGATDGLVARRITRQGFRRTWRGVTLDGADGPVAEFLDAVRVAGGTLAREGWRERLPHALGPRD